MTTNPTDRIPIEVWLLIAGYLPVRDVTGFAATSWHVRNILMPLLHGCKLLQILAHQDEGSAVQFLTKTKPIDIRVRDSHAMTVLHYAAIKGFETMVWLLIQNPQHNALINVPEMRQGYTPLIIALRCQRLGVFQMLLDAGANVNLQNAAGENVLFWAVKRRRTDLVRLLLKRGADPDQMICHGLTALILAIMDDRLDLVTVLVEEGCNVEQPDGQGYRPLAWAVIYDNLAIVEALLSHGPSLSTLARGKEGERSPLVWAVMKGNVDMVRLLLRHGAEIRQTQTFRRPPLIWAVFHRDVFMAEVLLQNGARPDEADGPGDTALMLATKIRDNDMIRLLVEYGADTAAVRTNER